MGHSGDVAQSGMGAAPAVGSTLCSMWCACAIQRSSSYAFTRTYLQPHFRACACVSADTALVLPYPYSSTTFARSFALIWQCYPHGEPAAQASAVPGRQAANNRALEYCKYHESLSTRWARPSRYHAATDCTVRRGILCYGVGPSVLSRSSPADWSTKATRVASQVVTLPGQHERRGWPNVRKILPPPLRRRPAARETHARSCAAARTRGMALPGLAIRVNSTRAGLRSIPAHACAMYTVGVRVHVRACEWGNNWLGRDRVGKWVRDGQGRKDGGFATAHAFRCDPRVSTDPADPLVFVGDSRPLARPKR
jgi:hypothetical protein